MPKNIYDGEPRLKKLKNASAKIGENRQKQRQKTEHIRLDRNPRTNYNKNEEHRDKRLASTISYRFGLLALTVVTVAEWRQFFYHSISPLLLRLTRTDEK